MARNIIKHIFGILKHQFHILILAPKSSLQVQARIPAALCTIHNLIHLYDPQKGPLLNANEPSDSDEQSVAVTDEGDVWDCHEMAGMCDEITRAMWGAISASCAGARVSKC